MRIFDLDGPVMQAVNWIGNTFLVNLCFIICCFPVFSIGAAVTALYSVYLLDEDDSWAVTRFFRAFKSNFRQSTKVCLVMLCAIGAIMLNFYALSVYSIPGADFLRFFLYIVSFLVLSIGIFLFGLIAKFENSVKQTVKNALILTVGMMLPALIIVLITILPLLLLIVDVGMFLDTVLLWIMFGFAVCTKINAFIMKQIFKKVLSEQQV